MGAKKSGGGKYSTAKILIYVNGQTSQITFWREISGVFSGAKKSGGRKYSTAKILIYANGQLSRAPPLLGQSLCYTWNRTSRKVKDDAKNLNEHAAVLS